MLERVPTIVGHALRHVHADIEKLAINSEGFAQVPMGLDVRSPVFDPGEPIPALYTADGERLSPPLTWTGTPPEARSVALVIEDADSPTPDPLVHALAWNFEGRDAVLVEGELSSTGEADSWSPMGLNSFLRSSYLAPDPPPGHGRHRYAFQVFALDCKLELSPGAGRSQLLRAMRGHVLTKGCVVGTYERAGGRSRN